jgi:beta-barrel assembly-enhancing protease
MRSQVRHAIAVVLLPLLLASCATSVLPPISLAGGSFEPLDDELELWEESRAEEEKLLESVQLYDDPLLESYLEDIVRDLTPPGMAANPHLRYKVRIIEDPTLNAFAYPHGSIYIHTGLMARLENEDQLATVLGHEMSHVDGRHMLRQRRSAENKEIGFAVLSVAASVVAAGAEWDAWSDGDWGRAAAIDVFSSLIVDLGLQLAFVASVNGYGRKLETEADYGAFAKLESAGYDLGKAPGLYEVLLADYGEKGESGKFETFFFGSHPRLTERISSTRAYLVKHPASAEQRARDAEAFAQRLRPVIRDDAALNLEIGRLEIAEAQLDRVRSQMQDDPKVRQLSDDLRLAREEKAGAAAAPN